MTHLKKNGRQHLRQTTETLPPLRLKGRKPKTIHYELPIAFVKSALMFAALRLRGGVSYYRKDTPVTKSTEDMLQQFAVIWRGCKKITVHGHKIDRTEGDRTRRYQRSLLVSRCFDCSKFRLVLQIVINRTGIIDVIVPWKIGIIEIDPAAKSANLICC